MDEKTLSFVAQLSNVKTTRDGGITVTLAMGLESLEAAQELMALYTNGQINLAVAIKPYEETY